MSQGHDPNTGTFYEPKPAKEDSIWGAVVLVAIICAVAVGIPLFIIHLGRWEQEAQQWDRFKSEHKCLLVGQSKSGNVGYREAWFCNNGTVYYRD